MRDFLHKKAIELQNTLEGVIDGNLGGTCYLIGYCLTEILKKQGFESRCVSGTLAIIMQNEKKYAKYGNSKIKGDLIGNYHTWCEVVVGNEVLIIDPSLKYNIKSLKSFFKLKINKMIPAILITSTPSSYYYKYVENNKLERCSKMYLNALDTIIINSVIEKTLKNMEVSLIKNCD